jgi:PAS domain S-box-containing protein
MIGGKKIKPDYQQNPGIPEVTLFYPDFFWSLFNSNYLGVAISDLAGNIRISNKEFSKAALQGGSANLADYVANNVGEKINPELTVFHMMAADRQIRLHRMLLKTAQGEVYCWILHLENFARKKKVAIFKNLYRSFIDNTFELVFRTSEQDQILFSNNLFVKTFGFVSYRDVLTCPAQDLFETPEHYLSFKRKVKLAKKVKYEQVSFKCCDGRKITGLVNCHVLDDEKGLPVLNWTVLDISERLEYDQSLRQKNDQLAKVNNQMEKFLYSTSHDLRSPLTSILGLVNLVKLDTKNTVVLDYISKIETSALKLDQIIKDVMSFSKTTYQRVKAEKIDFNGVIGRIFENYARATKDARIAFEKRVVGETPYYSDSERIDIILDNLMRNAIAFYDANKVNPFIRVSVELEAERAIIEIADNGIGIGRNHLEFIFNMFYKASYNSKGAGLGLYIVKEAVEGLSGSITVESEIGFGSIFKVIIPNDHKGRLVNRKLMLQRQA